MELNVNDVNKNEVNANDEFVLPKQGASTEPRKQRERRQQSPNKTSLLLSLEPPLNGSALTSSLQAANDVTFEPTIDMMVNDFDDEQTLNEEEALAASEQQDPQDEIATLKEESEMPLEALLAKYQGLPRSPPPTRKKKKVNKNFKNKHNSKSGIDREVSIDACESTDNGTNESGNEDEAEKEEEEEAVHTSTIEHLSFGLPEESIPAQLCENFNNGLDAVQPRRSFLLDLYPEKKFESSTLPMQQENKMLPPKTFYTEDDEVDSETEEEADHDTDFVKKTIMVGSAYQAVIPLGLSQYGDVLPYENEDKLIWEPSQVSEREVEEYLLKARDIKPTLLEDEITSTSTDSKPKETEGESTKMAQANKQSQNGQEDETQTSKTQNGTAIDNEIGSVVKDNEQALHLLVQCGYDFKEALRRKRLNALPLTGSMSIWSEEECIKFEEGIQKFGKDFLRIRQNQVRTRSMRELVLFYYLWKKSERRDHDFANADTVDHMDIYLNESGDYGTNTTSASADNLPLALLPLNARNRQHTTSGNNASKNISIMAVSHVALGSAPVANLKPVSNRKRNTSSHNVTQLLSAEQSISASSSSMVN